MLDRIAQMVYAIERAADSQARLADRLMSEGDYSAEFPAADAEALASAAMLLRGVGCISPALDQDQFTRDVMQMGEKELRVRVLAQAHQLREYATCIDGMQAAVGEDGRRAAADVKESFRRALIGVRAPNSLDNRQVASLCFSINHGYGLLPQAEQAQLREQVKEFYRMLMRELREPSQHPMVLEAAHQQTGRDLFGDDFTDEDLLSGDGSSQAVAAVTP